LEKADMKHILFVSTSFPDKAFQAGQEAAGSFVYDFAHELGRHVRVTAIVPGMDNGVEQDAHLTVRRFAVPNLPLSLLQPANPAHWQAIWRTMRAGQQAVTAVAQVGDVDHIFALWALPSGYWARRASQKYNIPYSIWALGSDIWNLGKLPLVKNVLQTVLRNSQHCFADGYQLADDVTAISGRPCAFLPSSRRLPLTGTKQLATEPPYNLAFLGRWHPHKGVDLLLESLQLLTDADWAKIKAVQICGGGPLEALVHEQVGKLQGNGRPVTVNGYLNRDEAAALLQWADYLLLPSRIESIPVIFSDAMQSDCPVIAMPVGDLPRLMAENRSGTVASTITAEAMQKAIQNTLCTSPLHYQTGILTLKQEFNVHQSVRRLLGYLWGPT
jgi:glycosyltransferase involved in cell wall biosynthesis